MELTKEPKEGVVPMHMGVNRLGAVGLCRSRSCPHAHGGEPFISALGTRSDGVVPMHMGVNRVGKTLEPCSKELSPCAWG